MNLFLEMKCVRSSHLPKTMESNLDNDIPFDQMNIIKIIIKK